MGFYPFLKLCKIYLMELTEKEKRVILALRERSAKDNEVLMLIHRVRVGDGYTQAISHLKPAPAFTIKESATALIKDVKEGVEKNTLFVVFYEPDWHILSVWKR